MLSTKIKNPNFHSLCWKELKAVEKQKKDEEENIKRSTEIKKLDEDDKTKKTSRNKIISMKTITDKKQ